MDLISNGLRTLCAWLCSAIYMLVASLYDLFINISRVEILTSDQIQPIYQRITMILTIVMVFYVTFETVKFVIQPEQFSDKEKGVQKIVIRMVSVVLLIAFVPQIFSGAYWVQNKIFDTQVFSKVILGKQNVDSDQFGKNLSYNIFSMFYSLDTESFSESELESQKCGNIPCKQVVLMNYNQLRTEGKLTFLGEGLNESGKTTDKNTGEKVERYYINFNGLFAVAVGGFIAYMLLLYCVDAGVRVVQLLFLQIIAPIPIMAYLSPKKDGMFEKWTKQCLTTYLDLFLRVGIIYFILLICQILGNAFTNGTLVNNVSGNGTWLIYIALIMGLLLFAHKAPKMLGELFPKMGAASGNFGLKATDRVAPEAARIAGAALGGTRFVGSAIARGVNKHIRNKANNAHAPWTKEGQEETRQRQRNRQHARNMKRDLQTVAGMQSRVSDDELNASKKKVREANDKYRNLKGKGTQEEADAKKERDQAAAEYRDLMRKRSGLNTNAGQEILDKRKDFATARKNLNNAQQELDAAKATNDPAKIAEAQNKKDQAEKEFKDATKKYEDTLNKSKAEDNVGQNWAGIINSQQEAKASQEQLNKAQQELALAQTSGNEAQIKIAQAKVDWLTGKNNQKQELFQMQKDSYKNIQTSDEDTQKVRYEEALSQVAEDNNTRYVNPLGAAAVGAVSGFATGVREGFKAQKLEEIIPKAKEGYKKDIKNIQELNKFYDNGGAQGIQGYVDRTVANIEKNVIGIDTAYARTMMSTKEIETKIKEMDAQISLAKDAGNAFDDADNVARKKSQDLKAIARKGKIKTGFKDANGDNLYAEVEDGETTGQVVRKYYARAEVAKNESELATKRSDEAAKEAQDAKLRADNAEKDTNINQTDKERLRREAQTKQQLAEMAEKNKIVASKKAQDAKYEAEQVEKNAAREEITQILEGIPGNYTPVVVQKVTEGKNSFRSAASNPQLREKIKEELYRMNPKEAEKLFNEFITQHISNADNFDAISTAHKNVTSAVSRSKTDASERKRAIETSDQTQAQKAAQDYNGSGGK